MKGMNKAKQVTPKQVETPKQNFDEPLKSVAPTKDILIIKPKSLPKKVFFYQGEQSLSALCKMLSKTPTLDLQPNGTLAYGIGKKFPSLYKAAIIFLDSFGEVSGVEFDVQKVLNTYDFVSERDVNESDKPQTRTTIKK